MRSLGGGRKKVRFRIDGEPATRALGVAIQHARSEETVIECRPKYSSPSMGPIENMNKELCGLVRCFRIYFRGKAKDGDHDRVSTVAMVGQTLWMDLEPLRCES